MLINKNMGIIGCEMPLVSVGLPVYNGERFVDGALWSLRGQDYPFIEIVISDNASTDRTPDICLEHARHDKRIRFIRSGENLGAAWNFNRVFQLSSGQYFMWAAHDDLWEPSCVRRCVEVLQADPAVALCHPSSQPMTDEGRLVGEPYLGDAFINDGSDVRGRWRASISKKSLHAAIYGVIRRSMMEKVRPLQVCLGADAVFIAELSLRGKIVNVPESLSLKRVPESLVDYRSHQQMLEYLGGGVRKGPRLAHLAILREMVRALRESDLPVGVRRQLQRDAIGLYFVENWISHDIKSYIIASIGVRRYLRWTRWLRSGHEVGATA